MTQEQYVRNLCVPQGRIDVVLDTDAYNEIDDQFAICYMLGNPQKFCLKGICAAPFLNSKSESPGDGMGKSYEEILKLLKLANKDEYRPLVIKGSESYLADEVTPVESDAAAFMAELAGHYTPKKPLYIVAIAAITNVASAILKNPEMKENCVVVWLGGHAQHMPDPACEFNMRQDIAAARVVFGCGIPVVQLPCRGVVDRFATSRYELLHWLKGVSPLCDYLCDNTIDHMEARAPGKPWSKPLWDVTAIGWLLNENAAFMKDIRIPCPIVEYDLQYRCDPNRHMICYVNQIERDALMEDLLRVLKAF